MGSSVQLVVLACVLSSNLFGQWNVPDPIIASTQQSDGISLTSQLGGTLRLQVCTDSIIHVLYSPRRTFPDQPNYVVTKTTWPKVEWTSPSPDQDKEQDKDKDDKDKDDKDKGLTTLTTARLKLTVARNDGAISFADLSGKPLMTVSKHLMRPEVVNGEKTYHAEAVVAMYGSHEGLYGLGQHQAGVWNYRGAAVDLSQENTEIAIPFFVSTNGYGVLWNNTSRSRFNNRFIHTLYLSSEVADVIDYYFIYGPDFDHLVTGYRQLTGTAPMYGRWAYGFWQSKNRYRSQGEILDVAHEYRTRNLPIDNIVQDWFWWNRKGEHVFNSNYPDPKGMIDDLHKNHFHFMISVWPFFEPGSKPYEEMDRRGFFVEKTKIPHPPYHADHMAVYDATNPEARKYYWSLIEKGLLNLGVDAWWLDTTEPETEGQEENILLNHRLAIGSGNRYANLYPLLTTQAVYEGQRSATQRKRVFILSRSAFAGAQRNAVTAWSGDILEDWESYKRQIPAGLNYSLSGMPYWTTDIGGFISGGNLNDPQYRELFVRWFEYGTFCPIFRTHGTRSPDHNELWSYGAEVEQTLASYDRLRYRLLPYIYSLAWRITSDSYTPMRPLVMDYQQDLKAEDTGDEFMYGPAFLVNPVTEQGARTRHLYLPRSRWFDFWTGATFDGGQAIDAAAPIDRIPLYVRAGSIVPLGPEEQYADQSRADPIELRVYPGASGSFTLYEDENDNYNYEKGAYATIPLSWEEASQTLTIGERNGSFPGMLQSRTVHVIFVSADHGAGIHEETKADKVVTYSGRPIAVSRPGSKGMGAEEAMRMKDR